MSIPFRQFCEAPLNAIRSLSVAVSLLGCAWGGLSLPACFFLFKQSFEAGCVEANRNVIEMPMLFSAAGVSLLASAAQIEVLLTLQPQPAQTKRGAPQKIRRPFSGAPLFISHFSVL
ncbi:hypothetical protein CR205_05225 [Alteribacter lacisalsi]|uniref:Uncharacterized protein n=1 Tax=Alteribacter lacisalsi TaxID=2045244 RepID=A0A2W0HMA4_9BACI|nr:hypothetical protein CR205_05225 [Alteribacter lacisalsi]